MSKKRGKRQYGFTLIEMLLTLALMSVTGLAVYQALASGVKVWQRGRQIALEGDVAIFLDKIATDLRNGFLYPQLKFDGKEERLTFSVMVNIPADKKKVGREGLYETQIGQVEYSLDRAHGLIIRRVANYSLALNKKFLPQRALVHSVKDLHFRYFYLRQDKLETEKDTRQGIPQAVEVTVRFEEKSGNTQSLQRFIRLPWNG